MACEGGFKRVAVNGGKIVHKPIGFTVDFSFCGEMGSQDACGCDFQEQIIRVPRGLRSRRIDSAKPGDEQKGPRRERRNSPGLWFA